MKPRLSYLLAALVGLVILSALAASLPPNAVAQTRAAAYNLWVMASGKAAIICTGTAILTPDGKERFLSAGHCVDDFIYSGRFWISQGSDPHTLHRVVIERWTFNGIQNWNDGDWAVFRYASPSFKPLHSLNVCPAKPQPGEPVWSWTGPLGMEPILRTGLYSGELHFPDDPETEEAIGGMGFVDIEGAPGSSGSGVIRMLNGKPCVFGVWVGGFRERPNGAIISWLPW
ncbi:MAG: hypothetical protein RML46_12745 [Anaerolineae bacterium]|nr:hypothetical protein [Anaerolineae bacterium]